MNGENQVKFIMVEAQPPLGILGIVREAFKVTIRNGKLMVSIMLPVFLTFSLLVLGAHLAFTSIFDDLSSKKEFLDKFLSGCEVDETIRRGIMKDVRNFLWLQLVIFIFSCVILLNFLVATVSSSSEAITGKKMDLTDMLLKIEGRWKRPITTAFYMTLISVSIMVLFFSLIGFVSVMTEGFSSIILMIAVVIFGAFCYLYVASVWMLSLVISVVEDDSSGLKAIDRAGELMKGKRFQGSILMLLLILISATIYITSFVMMKKFDAANWAPLVIRIPRIWLFCLVKLFMFVVYTVFYHECKRKQSEAGSKHELGYLPITYEEA